MRRTTVPAAISEGARRTAAGQSAGAAGAAGSRGRALTQLRHSGARALPRFIPASMLGSAGPVQLSPIGDPAHQCYALPHQQDVRNRTRRGIARRELPNLPTPQPCRFRRGRPTPEFADSESFLDIFGLKQEHGPLNEGETAAGEAGSQAWYLEASRLGVINPGFRASGCGAGGLPGHPQAAGGRLPRAVTLP
jgi:hypothetical protein